MNHALIEARRAPGILKKTETGEVLVRVSMVSYISGILDAIDESLARIPSTLEQNGMQEYNSEELQRQILRDGFDAVRSAVRARTLAKLEESALFPKVRDRLVEENVDAIPRGVDEEITGLVSTIDGLRRELDCDLDTETLVFESGKLCIPTTYREAIEPRYTLPVTEKDREAADEIRQIARSLAKLKKRGLQIEDRMMIPPRGGNPFLSPGLITRMVQGSKYSDDELVGFLFGIDLTH